MELDFLRDGEVELRGRKERERDAVIAAAFHEIAASAQALGAHPAKVLLPRIEQLCKECRDTMEKPLLMDILLTTEWGRVIKNCDYEDAGFRVISKDEKLMVIMYPRGKAAAVYPLDAEGGMDVAKGPSVQEKLVASDWKRAMAVFDWLIRRS